MSNVFKQLPWAPGIQALPRKREAGSLWEINIQKEPHRLCIPRIIALGGEVGDYGQ